MIKKSEIGKIYDFCERTVAFAKNDLKKRYAGSVLGAIWAYIQTAMMVVIYWFVFQYGLKNGAVDGVPFLPWFISGMMPWLMFSDIINSCMNCMAEYSYIVKKVVFNIDIIPASKIAVCVFIYAFFFAVVVVVTLCNHLFTGIYILQTILYLIAALLLAVPIGYAVCTVSVFFKDLGQIVSIILNMLMWATPIAWPATIVPEGLQWIIKINPMYFVVSGVRNFLIYGTSITADLPYLFYFAACVCALWAVCIPIYRRLLPHLADIL